MLLQQLLASPKLSPQRDTSTHNVSTSTIPSNEKTTPATRLHAHIPQLRMSHLGTVPFGLAEASIDIDDIDSGSDIPSQSSDSSDAFEIDPDVAKRAWKTALEGKNNQIGGIRVGANNNKGYHSLPKQLNNDDRSHQDLFNSLIDSVQGLSEGAPEKPLTSREIIFVAIQSAVNAHIGPDNHHKDDIQLFNIDTLEQISRSVILHLGLDQEIGEYADSHLMGLFGMFVDEPIDIEKLQVMAHVIETVLSKLNIINDNDNDNDDVNLNQYDDDDTIEEEDDLEGDDIEVPPIQSSPPYQKDVTRIGGKPSMLSLIHI